MGILNRVVGAVSGFVTGVVAKGVSLVSGGITLAKNVISMVGVTVKNAFTSAVSFFSGFFSGNRIAAAA